MATLLGIAIKPQRRSPMQAVSAGRLSSDAGLNGDCRGRPGRRQVTLLSLAAWHTACAEVGVELSWTLRRANLLVDALPLLDSTGAIIRLGDARLEVTGETDPCERMEQVHPGLEQALVPQWRGGVTCRVVADGAIQIGMPVALLPRA